MSGAIPLLPYMPLRHEQGQLYLCVTSGFRRGVNEVFALLGCYTALTGN